MKHRHILIAAATTAVLACAIVYTLHPVRYLVRTGVTTATARFSEPADQPFPDIDTSGLSEMQKKIVDLARTEYAKRPISYDENVQKYTQGNNEAWCADFASWIMREAGMPFNNLHSGGWRIPGVYTLQEYFETQNRYQKAGDYTPRIGDIAFLHYPSGHVAVVLDVHGDTMTTIGGNENGRMRVSYRSLNPGAEGLVGFGTLPQRTTLLP